MRSTTRQDEWHNIPAMTAELSAEDEMIEEITEVLTENLSRTLNKIIEQEAQKIPLHWLRKE